jgi:hypothetical protein
MLKLKENDVILVHGWVMLQKVEGGTKYRVSKIDSRYGHATYTFARPRGSKAIITHYAENVDPWIRDSNHPDLNRIEIVRRAA